ncbi:hypothetical protein SFRURICE_007381 [Spodoptera frugiperda]|nr:hypothetical protein SFRURICE_007381 [Spodoptera frugiperda]
MMITILGFPPKTKYQDVKILIKQECNISDFILDNLVNDSTAVGTKKVRIGLTDNAEGYKVMKCLDGYRMPGNYVLKAMPVGKTATNLPTQGAFDTHMSYQDHPRNDYSAAPRNDYMGQSNSFNNQPHGSGMHSTAPHVARPTHGQGGHSSQMEINRPSPWATGNNSTQWTAGPSMASQVPQNTFGGFNSPQASITSPFGQQHHQNPVHSRPDMRPGFNQTRTHTEQSYGGYPPKTNVPEVPANSRYRWFRKVGNETQLPKSPSTSPKSYTDEPETLNPSSNPSSPDSPVEDKTDIKDDTVTESTGNNETDPSEKKLSKKARKREEARLRDLSKISSTCRRRLYWWIKRGKTFMEARQLCETRFKNIPEYAAAKKEKKIEEQQKFLRKLDPEQQARAERFVNLINKAEKTGKYICVRVTDTETPMSDEQLNQLQDKVLELVEEEQGNVPSICGCTARYGTLKLAFTTEESVEWLEKHLPDLHLWEGASLGLINIKDKRPAIGVAYIPDPTLDQNSIIKMLKEENPLIDFSNWWISSIKADGSNGFSVTFAVDQDSVPALLENNCFIHIARRKIKMRIKTKRVTGPKPTKHFGPKGPSQISPELMDQWYSTPLEQWYPGLMGGVVTGPIPQPMGPMGEMGQEPTNFYSFDQYYAPSSWQPQNFGGGKKNKAYDRWNDNRPRNKNGPRGSSNNSGSGKFGGPSQQNKHKGQQNKPRSQGGPNYIKPGTYIRPGSNKPKQNNKSGNNNRPGQNNKPGNTNNNPGQNSRPGNTNSAPADMGQRLNLQPRQETRHALRSIETVDTNTASRAPIHSRYPPSQPYQQEKSVTIMKDNFQGPTPYNISNPGAQTGSGGQQYPTTAPSSSPWQSQEYEKRHGFSPRRDTIAHGGRSVERRPSPPARRISPPGRRVSPHARKFSPAGKRPSPDRHVLTHHTASHSHHPGRRDSPHKRPSPMRRLVSPPRRTSPGRRPSPGRRDSPQRMSRYSPERHHSDKLDKFTQDKLKQVRPAYEPSSHRSSPPSPTEKLAAKRSCLIKRHSPSPQDAPNIRRAAHLQDPYQRSYPKLLLNFATKEEPEIQLHRDDLRKADQTDSRIERVARMLIHVQRNPQVNTRKPHPQREDYDQVRRPREHEERMHPDEYHRRREPSPRRDSRKDDAANPIIDKDFEDIYKRALQFKKKAEELRRLGSKKRDDYVEDEARSYHSEREREDRSQRYEDRHRYREEELLRHREREERPRDDRPRDDRPRDDRPRDDRPRDDRPRDDRPRDDRLRDDRPRDDRSRDDRPRDDRSRDDGPRDDRQRDDRPRHDPRPDDMRRPEFRPREEYSKQPDREQDRRFTVNPAIRVKRDKAIEEICKKLLDKHPQYQPAKEEYRARIMEELQLAIARIVFDMFGDSDVAFIEIIIKFQAKYSYKDEEKILQDVMSSLPSHYRASKRQAPEPAEVPAKIARRSASPSIKTEPDARPKLSQSRWNVDMLPPELVTMPMLSMQPGMATVLPPGVVPMMVPAPFMHPYKPVSPTPVFAPEPEQLQYQEQASSSDDDMHKLYLCKDDFDQISAHQADLLKEFLITQMIKETQISQGWAPDFTLKGLQNTYRYEILTKDDITRDWLINLDFSQFEPFHVLAYTKEELWYQRAAVWLPGHSRSRNIEPLDKLKLQNKKLEGVNVHSWKYVKKIVTQKGTRLYVDMPPASARALEKHKMMLSYELQKVNVFLKSVAVDKNVFDAGLKQQSTITTSQISDAIQNSPMPSLSYDPSLVKITLKGCKTLTLTQARKIKEVLIYQMFRYHQQDGSSRTDFIKYGFFPPNSFGVIPQNPETKKWLLSQHLGKVNRQTIVVQGGQDEYTRYFRMTAVVPNENYIVPGIVAERIKQSNQGVKGINFNLWKPIRATSEWKKAMFEVDIDLESLETLSHMKYQLDYVDQFNVTHSVYFKSEHTEQALEEMIHKYKAEMSDSYDVANMDLDSDSGDDVI